MKHTSHVSRHNDRHPTPYFDGSNLRDWRTDRNLTARGVANKLGVSVPTYYRLEDGRPPTLDIANRIVCLTHGKIRYRDLWPGFKPEYA